MIERQPSSGVPQAGTFVVPPPRAVRRLRAEGVADAARMLAGSTRPPRDAPASLDDGNPCAAWVSKASTRCA